MSKFNLKKYAKSNSNEHTTMRLQKEHKKESDVVNQKQLENYRVNEDKDVVVEKLLENKRLGAADSVTERQLDTGKAMFENKYRNKDAHKGDINKLEEKRLKSKTSESEKYEAASSTPKSFRWWENVKSPDGLKVASKSIKTAQIYDMDDDSDVVEELIGSEGFNEPTEEEAEEMVASNPYVDPTEVEEDDFVIDDSGALAPTTGMFVLKQKDLKNPQHPMANGIYMVLAYSPEQFGGDEDRIKSAAYDKVVSVRPELADIISPDDFGDIKESGTGGTVTLRAVGDDIYNFFQSKKSVETPSTEEGVVGGGEFGEEGFAEVSYKQSDIGGTPMILGKIKASEPITRDNRESVLAKAIEFINSKHPETIVDVDSLDLSKLDIGEISFMVSAPDPSMEMASPEELAELENVSDIEPETDLGLGQAEEGEQSKDPAELIEEPSDALEGWLKGHPAKRTSIKDQSEEEDDRDADQLMNELDSLIGNVGKTPPLKNLATTGSDNFEIREITADTKKK